MVEILNMNPKITRNLQFAKEIAIHGSYIQIEKYKYKMKLR